MELPSSEAVILTDANGNPARVKVVSNEGVTGNYKSSEGVGGEAVWGTRARWMELYGKIGDEKISRYNSLRGVGTFHPLVSVVDISKATPA